MMHITLRQLRVFVAVARTENVSRAAGQLSLTQSAVSMALKELELQLGRQLFDRAGKRMQLNAHGEWLFPRARRILDQVGEISDALGQAGRQQLSIGASTTIADCLFPTLAGHLYANDPLLNLQLETGNSDTILALLLARKIDLGLVEGVCQHPQVSAMPWWTDRLVIVASPGHPLVRRSAKKALQAGELAGSQWMLREPGSGTRAIFEHAFRSLLPELILRAELKHLPTLKSLVADGDCLTCLSEISVAAEVASGKLAVVDIEGIELERQFYILEHRQAYRSERLDQLIDWIRNTAKARSAGRQRGGCTASVVHSPAEKPAAESD